ncbi:hypothetical protein LBMAG56_32240 [Verrucomicrobiota bacterium]|nr:hypothetical protein LBMAG56_32240 [Verrucomicrobiota bacterium]
MPGHGFHRRFTQSLKQLEGGAMALGSFFQIALLHRQGAELAKHHTLLSRVAQPLDHPRRKAPARKACGTLVPF